MGNGEETDGIQTGEGWVGVRGRCLMCLYMSGCHASSYSYVRTVYMYVHTVWDVPIPPVRMYSASLPLLRVRTHVVRTYVRTYVYSECECVGVQMCVGVFWDVDGQGSTSDLEETKPFEATT